MTKRKFTAKPRGTSPELAQENVVRTEKRMQKWIFLDADGSESLEFGEPILEDFFMPSSEGQTLSKDVFERMNSMVEQKDRDVRELRDAPISTTVRVRIGVLVPEGKAQGLAKNRGEFWSNST